MAEVSTVVTVKKQIVTKLTTALDAAGVSGGQIPVDYAWPGAGTAPEAVFLGRHPELDDLRLDVDHDLRTLVAGRKQRQEVYELPMTVWTFRPDLTADGAETCETRAFAILDPIEDVFADDPTIGLGSGVVQWVRIGGFASTLWPFQKGWACELLLTLNVQARLQ